MISEFSLRMSSTYELAARRRLLGAPAVLFWLAGCSTRHFARPTQQGNGVNTPKAELNLSDFWRLLAQGSGIRIRRGGDK